ncbi:hypothetical protein BDW75DRAFT_225889 [Aspergillus navahoensis]
MTGARHFLLPLNKAVLKWFACSSKEARILRSLSVHCWNETLVLTFRITMATRRFLTQRRAGSWSLSYCCWDMALP